MTLLTFISFIWAGFSPVPRRRRTVYIDPDSIEPINHWFPGNRNKKQPRRLVETPTAGHWPEHRVAKSVVDKGRKRCGQCGALVKEIPGSGVAGGRNVAKGKGQGRSVGAGKNGKTGTKAKATTVRAVRSLRGRSLEYAG